MRIWQFWWRTVVFSSQYNPPRFIEVIMLLLAMILLGFWAMTEKWPYLALSLSYVVGASTSMLVREAITPSPQLRVTQVTAVLLLITSLYSFFELAPFVLIK